MNAVFVFLHSIYLYICCLFNDAISISDCIAFNEKMVVMNWKLLNIKAVHFSGATLSWCVDGDAIKR